MFYAGDEMRQLISEDNEDKIVEAVVVRSILL